LVDNVGRSSGDESEHPFHSEGIGDPSLRIRQERKRERVFLLEGPMTRRIISADANHLGFEFLKLGKVVPKTASLLGTDRGAILRVEEQNDGAVRQNGFEATRAPLLIEELKRRRNGSNGEKRHGAQLSSPTSAVKAAVF